MLKGLGAEAWAATADVTANASLSVNQTRCSLGGLGGGGGEGAGGMNASVNTAFNASVNGVRCD